MPPTPQANQKDADENLMLRYGQGDTAAFEVLYARHKDPLYRFVLRGVGNAAPAAELAQDVWIRVIEARLRYQPTAKFTTWLYQIAHNRLVDHWRARHMAILPVDDEIIASVAAAPPAQPEVQTADADCAKLLLQSLAALPEEQRELILLREEGELSIEEMAQVQGVGRETAKSRLRYALAKLKEALHDCLE